MLYEAAPMVIALSLLTALWVAVTLIPVVPAAHGFVRICDFPRLQVMGFAAATLLAVPFLARGSPARPWLTVALLAVIVVQGIHILRFTRFWRRQSVDADGEVAEEGTVSILSSNVKLSNRDYARTLRIIEDADPDIVILIEVDEDWCQAISGLKDRWPHAVTRPLDTGYGICLYSRLPLEDVLVRDLLTNDVPSITTTVRLRDGRPIRLYALHPEPPVPYADTVGRDAEIALVAAFVREDPIPAIVTGDLNDVAWSRTTRRFQRLARHLDPRVGRGFYNSFDATRWWMRWPLDHLFHDPAFRLVTMARLPFSGSDHFPMFFKLALGRSDKAHAMPEESDVTDEEEAEDLIEEAIERGPDREPIGVDWEKT